MEMLNGNGKNEKRMLKHQMDREWCGLKYDFVFCQVINLHMFIVLRCQPYIEIYNTLLNSI